MCIIQATSREQATGEHKKLKHRKSPAALSTSAPPVFNPPINNPTATEAARNAVFSTAELFEDILLYLPARALFSAQRVSKQFRDMITTSSAIRQKLFLDVKEMHAEPETWVTVEGVELGEVRFMKTPVKQGNAANKSRAYTPARLNPL